MKLAFAVLTLFVALNAHANSGSSKVGKLLEPSGPFGVGKSELTNEFFKELSKEQQLRNNPPADKKSERESESELNVAANDQKIKIILPPDTGFKGVTPEGLERLKKIQEELKRLKVGHGEKNVEAKDLNAKTQLAEKSDEGLKRILSRPRPLAPKEPVKPAQSSELNLETPDQSADASS